MSWQPCGTYNVRYTQDMTIFRTRPQKITLILFLIFLFTLPLYSSRYIMTLISMISITIITVEGLCILTGHAGQISIGQAAFVGVGAYLCTIFIQRLGLPFLPAMVCAALFTGVIGLIFGLSALRVKGFYLAMSTLAAQLILGWSFLHLHITGGTHGLFVDPARIFGFEFSSIQSKYLMVVGITCIMIYFAKNLMRSRLGRNLVAVRDNDLASNVMGINPSYFKLVAFFISTFYAGVAGSLWAHFIGFINPDQFILQDSILYLGMLIIGGMGNIMGPIFGVTFMKILEEISIYVTPIANNIFPAVGAQAFAAISMALYASVVVVFLLFEPRGVNHIWNVLKSRYRLYPFSY